MIIKMTIINKVKKLKIKIYFHKNPQKNVKQYPNKNKFYLNQRKLKKQGNKLTNKKLTKKKHFYKVN